MPPDPTLAPEAPPAGPAGVSPGTGASLGGRNPWAILAVASIAVFMVFLDTQVLFVAFSDLRASFPDVSAAGLSWVLSAYTIVLAALLVPAGRLADRVGRKRVFLGALVVFTVASGLCALATSP